MELAKGGRGSDVALQKMAVAAYRSKRIEAESITKHHKKGGPALTLGHRGQLQDELVDGFGD